MKQHYVSILLGLLSVQGFAQTTLYPTNGFNNGTVIHVYADNAPILDEGSSGANKKWDFSSLYTADAAVDFNCVPASSTPHAADFPNAQLATLNISPFGDSIYNYFTNESSVYSTWGYESNGALVPYSDPRDILHYPFTYGDSFTDTYLYESPYASDYGTVEVKADAYGTLTLPTGTFPNCLRVREVRRDSTLQIMLVTAIDTSYKFYVAGYPEPLCQVNHHHNSQLNSFNEINWQDVQPNSITTVDDGAALKAFPVPCDEMLNLNLPEGKISMLKITDVTGRVFQVPFNQQNNLTQLNTSQLPGGIYFISTVIGGKAFQTSFVKVGG